MNGDNKFSDAKASYIIAAFDDACLQVAMNEEVHGFWDSTEYLQADDKKRQLMISEKLLLIHSEVSEAVEVLRKDPALMSDKINALAVSDELADIIIRTFGVAYRLGVDLGDAFVQKHNFNCDRPHMHRKKF